jgi:uncharacterized protein YecE (DUF72 family)
MGHARSRPTTRPRPALSGRGRDAPSDASNRLSQRRDPASTADVRVRIGISGWSYKPWRRVFYPPGLRIKDELGFASRAFGTIELNGSFYSLQRPESYRSWRDTTPDDFVFSIKGGRFVTHMKRLKDAEPALANFFASGVLELGAKLGPILWQLPPSLGFDAERLRAFFELLPRTRREGARLARRHAAFLANRVAFGDESEDPIRHALEVRHPSFVCPEFIALLRAHDIAPCVADSAGLYPVIEDLCADFVYVRLHGAERLYTSGYDPPLLALWARRIERWHRGLPAAEPRTAEPSPQGDGTPRDVYVYFDNDVKVRAPFDAANLERILRGGETRDAPRSIEAVTEEPRTVWPAWQRRA